MVDRRPADPPISSHQGSWGAVAWGSSCQPPLPFSAANLRKKADTRDTQVRLNRPARQEDAPGNHFTQDSDAQAEREPQGREKRSGLIDLVIVFLDERRRSRNDARFRDRRCDLLKRSVVTTKESVV